MKRLHKILIAILTVSLLLGVIVVSAFASNTGEAKIGDTSYATLAEAVAAANASDGADVTITLTSNVTLTAPLAVTREGLNLVIDLAGYTVTTTGVVREENADGGAAKLGAINALAENGSLTVKGGVIFSAGTNAAAFCVDSAELKLEALTVNIKGGANAPAVYAVSGSVDIVESDLTAYGADSSVLRVADATVSVTDSKLTSLEGSGEYSSAIRLDITAPELPEPPADDEGGAEPLSDAVGGEAPAARVPDIAVTDSVIFAANTVIRGYIAGEEETEPVINETYTNTLLSFENCVIKQENSEGYNTKLLSASRNALLIGWYIDAEFDGCDVDYARTGFTVSRTQKIDVKNSSFTMTFAGQDFYLDGEVQKACPSYIFKGAGAFTAENSEFRVPKSSSKPICDALFTDIAYTAVVEGDEVSQSDVAIGKGTFFNVAGKITADLLAEGCQVKDLGIDGYGAYVTDDGNLPASLKYRLTYCDYEDYPNFSADLRDPITAYSGALVGPGGDIVANTAVRIFCHDAPAWMATAPINTEQGRATIEESRDGNKYFCFDPAYVYNPYREDNIPSNGFDGGYPAWDVDGNGTFEYRDTNGDGVADSVYRHKTANVREWVAIPERFTKFNYEFSGYITYQTIEYSDCNYYTVDFDLRTGYDADAFVKMTIFNHGRSAEGKEAYTASGATIDASGKFGTQTLKFDDWNHITMLVAVDHSDYTKSVAYFFADGVLAAKASNFASAAGVVSTKTLGIRYTSGQSAIGRNAQVCYDNVVVSTYSTDYYNEAIAAIIAGEANLNTWADAWYASDARPIPEYGYCEAELNGTPYETYEDAYAAANDGDEITIFTDVEGLATVNKAITVNTGGYKFTHTSATHVADKSGNTVTFKSAKPYEMASINYVNGDTVDTVKVAQGNYSAFSGGAIKEGVNVKPDRFSEFLGWNTRADGSGDTAPTIAYVSKGTSELNFYAIYNDYGYGALYAVMEGDKLTYGYDVASFIKAATELRSATITMFGDITIPETITRADAGVELSVDLNGHKLICKSGPVFLVYRPQVVISNGTELTSKETMALVSQTKNTPMSNADWVAGGYKAKYSGDNVLNIYSSNEGAYIEAEGNNPIFHIRSEGANYIYYYDASGVKKSLGLAGLWAYANLGEANGNDSCRISAKCGVLTKYEAYSCLSRFGKVDMVFTGSSPINTTGGYTRAENCTFVSTVPGSTVITTSSGAPKSVNFYNCTFVATPAEDGTFPSLFTALQINSGYNSTRDDFTNKYILENCNVYNAYLGAGSITTPSSDPYKNLSITGLSYNLPYDASNVKVLLPVNAGEFKYEAANLGKAVEINGKIYEFPYAFVSDENYAPETATVTWQVGDNTYTKEYVVGAVPNYTGPALENTLGGEVPYKLVLSGWVDAEGNAPAAVTADVTYTPNVDKLVADVKAQYNVTIKDDLTLNIYIPKHESIKSIAIGTGANVMELVTGPDGNEYYCARAKAISPNHIATEVTYYVTVETEYGTDTQAITLSILGYATELLAKADSSTEMKTLVYSMLEYSNEAYTIFDGSANSDVAALLTQYADLKSEVTVGTAADAEALAGVLSSATLSLKSKVSFVFTVKAGYEGTVTVNGTAYNVKGGDKITVAVAVKNVNEDLTISATVGEDTVSGTYNLAAYAAATTEAGEAYAIVKALIGFGNAAAAVN